MFDAAKILFNSVRLNESSVTPSFWVLCNIAPSHAKKTLSLYNLRLEVNSMEAREQKHQRIKKYAVDWLEITSLSV